MFLVLVHLLDNDTCSHTLLRYALFKYQFGYLFIKEVLDTKFIK